VRIRFFNTFEPVSPFYRDLLPFLADRGMELDLIMSGTEYRAGRGRLEDALTHPNINMTRIPTGTIGGRGRLQKLWIMLTYMAGTAIFTMFGRSAALNFFLTQPPLFSLWGYILRTLRRQPYCCLVMDIYPDVAIEDGLLGRAAFTTRILAGISRFILKQADAVIVIGRCMAQRVNVKGVAPGRVHIIPNWANEVQLHPVPSQRNPMRKELGLEDDFVVLYSGNIGTSHYFDDLLAVAYHCRGIKGLRFVFVGDGARRREVEQVKAQHHLDNLMLLPFQPLERLAESLSLGDVHFISLRPGFEGLVVPSKAYGVLAVGRPIIYQGSPEGEIARMVTESQCGTLVPLDDSAALEKVILGYYHSPALTAEHGQKALALARGEFSHRRALEKYYSLLVSSHLTTSQTVETRTVTRDAL
jgi:colanic acid biosynthesis glycosyl transferase WcaI